LGVIFVVLLGWRLVPARKASGAEGFETGAYLTEVRVPAKAKAIGMTLRQIETDMAGADAQIVGLIRNEVKMIAPHGGRRVREGDILMLEADVEGLAEALSAFGIKLEEQGSSSDREEKSEKAGKAKAADTGEGDKDDKDDKDEDENRREDEILLRELAVLPGSSVVGRSASDMHLRSRYGLNLLAVAREGRRPRARLRTLKLKSGDLLLMQGPGDVLSDFANETGCVPLGERDLRIPDARMAVLSTAIMGGAIALVTFGILPAAAAFALGVLVSMVVRTVPPREVYTAIDWPVIVLLAALIPVAGAMEQTGAADVLARVLVDAVAQGNAIAALAVI
ncbi:MAG: SLC13 family permease, partial [Paracoccaceae bacterium]|nr:SLC13 family permease [Paracoccaceae bacterium]